MGQDHAPPEAARRWTDAAGAAESGVAAEILELLMAVMGRLRSHLVDEVSRHDLNAMQFFALRSLTEPTPMGRLAEQLNCDRSHVTGVADELERRGALERQPHPDDRRVKLLVLTDVGEALRDRVEAGLLTRLPVVEGLSEAQQRQLRDLLATAASAGELEAGPVSGGTTTS